MGADLDKVVAGFDKDVANQVSNALVKFTGNIVKKQREGVVTL